MREGMNEQYLKELQQVLEAEAELARQGTDLLADPEYRALRELFVDGDISLEEFAGRVDALSASRPDENAPDAGESAEDDGEEDDWDDLDDDDEGLLPGQGGAGGAVPPVH